MVNYFLHDKIRLYSSKEYYEHKAVCPICQAFWKPLEEDFAKRLYEAIKGRTVLERFTTNVLPTSSRAD